MIYVDIQEEEAFTMDRDQLSILAANRGELVDGFEKPGLYMDDNFRVLNYNRFSKRQHQRELYKKKNRLSKKNEEIIKAIQKETDMNRYDVLRLLLTYKNALRKEFINDQFFYKLTDREIKKFLFFIKEKPYLKVLLRYKELNEAKEYADKHVTQHDIKGYDDITSYRQFQIRNAHKTEKIGGMNFYSIEEKERIESKIKEWLNK
jgi:hypothetical protein